MTTNPIQPHTQNTSPQTLEKQKHKFTETEIKINTVSFTIKNPFTKTEEFHSKTAQDGITPLNALRDELLSEVVKSLGYRPRYISKRSPTPQTTARRIKRPIPDFQNE